MSRNSGLLWAIQTSSSFFGNLFVYGLFKDLEEGLKTALNLSAKQISNKYLIHQLLQKYRIVSFTTRIMILLKNLFITNIFA
jgi:hypothetical protein